MDGHSDTRFDIHGTPYPNYVASDELRIRWNVAKRIAEVQAVIGAPSVEAATSTPTFGTSLEPSITQTSQPDPRTRSTTKMPGESYSGP
jgi:hypothetical protein